VEVQRDPHPGQGGGDQAIRERIDAGVAIPEVSARLISLAPAPTICSAAASTALSLIPPS